MKRENPNFFMNQENNNPDENKLTEVSFFFGAGASIKAGVPDTVDFVTKFVDHLKSNKEHKDIVEKIIKVLEKRLSTQYPKKKVDIELLLDAIQRLINKEQDILLDFYEGKKFALEANNINFESLQNTFFSFIKSMVIVEAEKIHFLEPLIEFIQKYGTLNIYSANYDTCIEQFCSEWKLVYKDGFDESWNPKNFSEPDIDIRLFKIHGSITWYRSNRGRYLKIPIMTTETPVKLITGEVAKHLMLYPAQKYEYVEPLFELLIQMKRELESCRILFVIGYSFRDDHIRNILWDVARKNREFHMVLIDPDARNIFNKRLRFYDGKTESLLNGRVLCLPYYFEKVLPDFKKEILYRINQFIASKAEGLPDKQISTGADWESSLVNTAEVGDTDTLQKYFERLDEKEGDYYNTSGKKMDAANISRSIILALMHSASNKDHNSIFYFWSKFVNYFDSFFKRLQLTSDGKPDSSVLGRLISKDSGAYQISRELDLIKTESDFIKKRVFWMRRTEILAATIDVLDEIYNSLKDWSNGFADGTQKETTALESYREHYKMKPPIDTQKIIDLIKEDGRNKITEILKKHTNKLPSYFVEKESQ